MRTLALLTFVVAAQLLWACEIGSTNSLPNGYDRAAEISAMVNRHNNTRLDAGLNPLYQNVLLNQIAQYQADYIADIRTLTHFDNQGRRVNDRADAAGYSWYAIGENIGYDVDSSSMYYEWLGSADHYDNITDADYRDIGVGVAGAGQYQYWCIVFGAR